MGHLAKPRDASFFRVFFNPYRYGVLTHLLDQFGNFSRRNTFGVHHDDRFFKRWRRAQTGHS